MNKWYDNEEEMRQVLFDKGLDGLREIVKARGAGKCEREWFINGRLHLTREGSLWVISEGVVTDPAFTDLEYAKRMLVDVQEFTSEVGPTHDWSARPFSLPPAEKCSWCGRSWILATVHDYNCGYGMHEKCVGLRNLQRAWGELRGIVHRAEIPVDSMNMVPNEYWGSDTVMGPWMYLKTPKGSIRIGWRKRVINIDWSGLDVEVSLDDLPDDVTKDATCIHAWGDDKAVEYLRVIYNSRSKTDG